jgi:hypothetical protein
MLGAQFVRLAITRVSAHLSPLPLLRILAHLRH